jgi:hypothetical protein
MLSNLFNGGKSIHPTVEKVRVRLLVIMIGFGSDTEKEPFAALSLVAGHSRIDSMAQELVFFQALDFSKAMIGKDLLLGKWDAGSIPWVHHSTLLSGITGADFFPNILVTSEQREAMKLGDLRRKDPKAYLSLSLVQISDTSEMNELTRGPQKSNGKQKSKWRKEMADLKSGWAIFEHSRYVQKS